MSRSLVLLLLAAALAPASADAATVRLAEIHIPDDEETFDREDDSERYSVLRFVASRGERNRLVIRRSSGGVLFQDSGARLRPGRGCRARTRHAVVCREGSDLRYIRVRLGRGSDRMTVSSRMRGPYLDAEGGSGSDRLASGGLTSVLSGGSGSDRLTGGRREDNLVGGSGRDRLLGRGGHDLIEGGTGADRLYGGDGDDVLNAADGAAGRSRDRLDGGRGKDRATYLGRRAGVVATMRGGGTSGERDVFRAIEGLVGGSGSDALTGDDRPNRLDGGGAGQDRIDARGGDDRIDVDYTLGAEDALDIACGDGSDRVVTSYTYFEHALLRGDCEELRSTGAARSLDPRPEPVTPADTTRLSLECTPSYASEASRHVSLRTPKLQRPWFSGPPFDEEVAQGVIPRGPEGSSCPTTFTLTARGRELLAALGTLPVIAPARVFGSFGVLLRRP